MKDLQELLRKSGEVIGIDFSTDELKKFAMFADELQKWNKKINLTAITSERDMVLKHFIDSLLLLDTVGPTGALLDIGSGGGFPCIPLKIMLPPLSVVSVDAVEKKILFQRHAARVLGLRDFNAVHGRGEALGERYSGHFDWIVSRAFSDIPSFVRMALPLLRENGKILAMKGKRGGEEVEAARGRLAELGVSVTGLRERSLPIAGDVRYLVVMERSLE